jgi:hypothetical protein
MKIKKAFKLVVVCFVFCASYLGVTYSTRYKKVAGERINVSLISLGNQASAYCSEATGQFPNNTGLCTGQFYDPTTRCLLPIDPNSANCLR